MTKQRENDEKLRELVLLIATLSEGDEPFGKVKLNKLAFYADFVAYLMFGKSITGHEYQRLPQGPAPRELLRVVPAFCKPAKTDPDIAVRVDDYYGRSLERPFALRVPNTKKFTPEELQLVQHVVQKARGMNAREMSEVSHRFVGWMLANDRETIPYVSALVGSREPTEEERRIGLGLEGAAVACLGGAL